MASIEFTARIRGFSYIDIPKNKINDFINEYEFTELSPNDNEINIEKCIFNNINYDNLEFKSFDIESIDAENDDTTINICDSCIFNKMIPECFSDHVEFGNGIGNDNIIFCPKYKY
jgi:hypothetical protein